MLAFEEQEKRIAEAQRQLDRFVIVPDSDYYDYYEDMTEK